MVVRTYCIFATTQPLKGLADTSCSQLWVSALCYRESVILPSPIFSEEGQGRPI